MSKQPDRRYGSALELLEAFRAALASAPAPAPESDEPRTAIALAITIEIDPEAAEDPDSALAADVDAIHIITSRALGERGLEVVMSAGNTMLFALFLPSDAEGERAGRLDCVNAALALRRELDGRPTRDPRARVSLCLHAGAARGPEETLGDGDLWDVPSWAFEGATEGVSATPEALRGLDVPARPWGEGGRMFRV